LRSTPLSTYEFVGDSPSQSTDSTQSANNEKKSGSKKTLKSKSTKPQTSKSKTKQAIEKVKVKPSMETPKTRTCKIVQTIPPSSLSVNKKTNRKPMTPIQQPNLEDISPIVRETTLQKKDPGQSKQRTLRSAEKARAAVDSPSLSFIVPRTNNDNSNDSAIFMSPRKTMPCFTSEKTSTPADIPRKIKKTKTAVLKAKNTSTPIEIKPKKEYTAIRKKPSVSPEPRTETPTSDYFSMELFETPELSPCRLGNKAKKRSHSPEPFVSVQDDGDNIALNKSMDRSYKHRSKKKFECSKKEDKKTEEMMEKYISELEDAENFELSVEG